jgi:hypothetical protein
MSAETARHLQNELAQVDARLRAAGVNAVRRLALFEVEEFPGEAPEAVRALRALV